MHNVWATLGMHEHSYVLKDTRKGDKYDDLSEFEALSKEPDFLGCAVTMPCKVRVMENSPSTGRPYLDKITPEAQAIGSCNTTFLEFRDGDRPLLCGTNTDWIGVRGALLDALATDPEALPGATERVLPSGQAPYFTPGKACSAIIGGGGTTRAAVYALNSLGCGPIYLINRDPAETQSIVDHFTQLELVPIESVEQMQSLLRANVAKGVRIPVIVGAIPAIAPVTEAEKRVYDISRALFAEPDLPGQTHPKERYFLEMCYKPRRTPMIEIAEDSGWRSVGGVDAMVGASDRAATELTM